MEEIMEVTEATETIDPEVETCDTDICESSGSGLSKGALVIGGLAIAGGVALGKVAYRKVLKPVGTKVGSWAKNLFHKKQYVEVPTDNVEETEEVEG